MVRCAHKEVEKYQWGHVKEKLYSLYGFLSWTYHIAVEWFAKGRIGLSVPKAVAWCGTMDCAADAGFVGFMVENNQEYNIQENNWYEIYGILSEEENTSYYHVLKIIPLEIKEIEKEEYYVYPCYYYNSCNSLVKYNVQ